MGRPEAAVRETSAGTAERPTHRALLEARKEGVLGWQVCLQMSLRENRTQGARATPRRLPYTATPRTHWLKVSTEMTGVDRAKSADDGHW